uniref:Cytochrome c oxidase subunit 7C, mitochondrial n=2 Tax=Neoaves TaxID=3078114 RepID=A0A8C0AST1_9AVES
MRPSAHWPCFELGGVGKSGQNYLQRSRPSYCYNYCNLPFSVDNKWRLLALMCGFFGSGFVAPFVIVRHQLLKK